MTPRLRDFCTIPSLLIWCFATAALVFDASAREGTLPPSKRLKVQPVVNVRQVAAPAIDAKAEIELDTKSSGGPLRFAVPHRVKISPITHGTWEDVEGGRLWRLRINAPGSTDLNFGFSFVFLPEGATLHIASETEQYFQGPYNSRDNRGHGELWTPVVPGDRAVIELFEPDAARGAATLTLSQISSGYRDMFRRQKDLSTPKSGSCNIDVACNSADPWAAEVRSVARYTVGGSGLCTGTLVNNGRADGTPFFLTAFHCDVTAGNASSVVVYWNYESPACGQHGGGSLSQNQSGAIFRAGRADVDMTLLELDELPSSSFQVFYAGWDRTTNSTVPGVVGIHHPSGDEKSISFSSNTVSVVNNCIGTGGGSSSTHYTVTWNSGITEPGSSGSGIWTHDTHRLVGFLSGGGSACSTPFDSDCYGRLSVAWNGSAAGQRLRDWLDPLGTAPVSLGGFDPSGSVLLTASSAALVTEGCTPTNGFVDPGETVTVSLSVLNNGGVPAVNVMGTLQVSGGVTSPSQALSFGTLAPGNSTARTFSFTANGTCGGTVTATLALQVGGSNSGNAVFQFPLGAPANTLTQNFDLVTTPALPAGWANTVTAFPGWTTTTLLPASSPNAAFAPNEDIISDATLTSPTFTVATAGARLGFSHLYDTEYGFDGGVLEISLNGGAFTDFVTAGGTFLSEGYNYDLDPDGDSPLPGRDAWTGYSGTYVRTLAAFPASAVGKSVRLRWRLVSDSSISEVGWWIDNVQVSDGAICCSSPPTLTNVRQAGNNVAFSFPTTSGKTYISEMQAALSTNAPWVPFATNAGDGTTKSVTNLSTATNRFIRVRVP